MSNNTQLVDQQGRPIPEMAPRTGDSLDVGFGGPIGNLIEKLTHAKEIMNMSETLYPYAKTGTKKNGTIATLSEEVGKPVPLKSLKEKMAERIDDEDDYVPKPTPKQLPKQQTIAQPKQKPVYEDENYIYYTKNGDDSEEDERYEKPNIKRAASLSSELSKASKENGKSALDMSAAVNEEMVRNSNLPDFIKQSFLKNPLTPPKITAGMGGGQLDAITEEFRKQKLINKKPDLSNYRAVPKKPMVEQSAQPNTKREKIKAQLRPIVEELIKEIFLQRL